MSNKNFGFGTQIRKSPYFDATVRWGATGFSVYNHMYIPRDFGNPEQNFWNLIEKAILCDVAVERQVEITGPDAFKFIQLLTPRDLSKLSVGQCKYVLITNAEGGVLNDPVLLRLGENHFWLSLGDSDILLWAQGVAINSGLDVKITESFIQNTLERFSMNCANPPFLNSKKMLFSSVSFIFFEIIFRIFFIILKHKVISINFSNYRGCTYCILNRITSNNSPHGNI